ncbi:MAG TPA: carboxylesterase family protein [Amycolatopsis sp.]|nr:carboxylesterase family protein [Amycolatopsis sp.]
MRGHRTSSTDEAFRVVSTPGGELRGRSDGRVAEFLGIPYGAPPVGGLRFAPPRPASGWRGVRDALAFGPAAPQLPETESATALPPSVPQDEDCLTLNVWTPAGHGDRLPVLVWFHGGGYRTGGPQVQAYHGANLARHSGVVVVSCAYRLGVLGFASHPALGEQANWGLRDQLLALEWVRENIAAFGGDPGAVTIFGQSAGAGAVSIHLACSAGTGLFHRAIVQSGAPKVDFPDEAAELAERLVHAAGAEDVRDLRTMPPARLLELQKQLEGKAQAMLFMPVVDGSVVTGPPLELLAGAPPLPALIGSNADEWRTFAGLDAKARDLTGEQLRRRLLRHFGDATDELVEVYRTERGRRGEASDPSSLWFAIFGDAYFRLPTQRMLEALAGRDVWSYLFTGPAGMSWPGACHLLEVPYVFGTVDRTPELAEFTGASPEVARLSRRFMTAWAAFATSGDPSSEGFGPWPKWEPGRRATMIIGDRCGPADAPNRAELDVLERAATDPARGVRVRN